MGIQKFQYDDFDTDDLSNAPEPRILQHEADELSARARQDGFAAGQADAHAAIEAECGRLLEQALAEVQAMRAELTAMRDMVSSQAVTLATMIARRVLPIFAEKDTLREIEGLITTCFEDRLEEQRIVIRLPDALLDPIQARLDKLVQETGFAGKPVLLADPSLSAIEARVEWANGGAEWSFDQQLQEIETLARRLASPKTVKIAAGESKESLG